MPRVVEYFGQSLKAALSRNINLVTFANLGSVRLPSLKFVGLRVWKIRRIQCVSCLSTTVSQLFKPQLQKVVIFGMHSAAIAGMQCLSVRPSVTFVSCAKTNKDIGLFEIFSPCGSQAILVFRYQKGWRYSNGNPLMGASNARGV